MDKNSIAYFDDNLKIDSKTAKLSIDLRCIIYTDNECITARRNRQKRAPSIFISLHVHQLRA
jgi:hypothetical protein